MRPQNKVLRCSQCRQPRTPKHGYYGPKDPDVPLIERDGTIRFCEDCLAHQLRYALTTYPGWDPTDWAQPGQAKRDGGPCGTCRNRPVWLGVRCTHHKPKDPDTAKQAARQVSQSQYRRRKAQGSALARANAPRKLECAKCSDPSGLELDHIRSEVDFVRDFGRAGHEMAHAPDNLQWLCHECHRDKTVGDVERV